jgi:methylmalonyl-CoA mutase N-terminal domain/subunit
MGQEETAEIRSRQEKWEQEYRGKYPQDKQKFTTSGIPIKPLYTPADIESTSYMNDLGFSGEYPYVRGVYPGMYRIYPWNKREVSMYGLPEQTNQRWKRLQQAGMTGHFGQPLVNYSSDVVGQNGYDCDDPLARGHIGLEGVSLSSLRDYEILFDGLPLDNLTVGQIFWGNANVHLAMLIACAEKQGVPMNKLNGVSVNSPPGVFYWQ